jgi:multidrug resistance efflux pump
MNPQLKGLISKVNAGMNQTAKKGEVLFEIDPTPFEAAVDQAEAQLGAARADVDLKRAAVEVAQATVAQARADASFARSERDAANELLEDRSPGIAKLKAEQANRAADAAEAAVTQALASVEQAKFALAASIQNVAVGEAAVKSARFDLGLTTYEAPADGMVINWQAREGTITTALRASAVGMYMDMSDTRIVVVLPQNLMRKVDVGDPAELAFKSRPGKIDLGKVVAVSRYTGEGQLAPKGDLPIAANVGSKGFLGAVVRLDDENLAQQLALGEAGVAAIYTQPAGPFEIVSKIYLRMLSIMFFLPL